MQWSRALERTEDLTRVVISYETYETSLRRVSYISYEFLFIIWPFKTGYYCLQNELYFNKKTHGWHGRGQWYYVYAPKCYYTCGYTIFMTRRYPLNNSCVIWQLYFHYYNYRRRLQKRWKWKFYKTKKYISPLYCWNFHIIIWFEVR